MKKLSVLIPIALLLFQLQWTMAGAQVSSPAVSELAVEIIRSDLSPLTVSVYQNGVYERTWSGDVPRISGWKPSRNDQRCLNIELKIRIDDGVVRIDVNAELESFKKVAIGTYELRPDELVMVPEVTQYGFKPFALKASQRMSTPSVEIPPLPALPQLENHLTSLEVLTLEKGDGVDIYVLSLRNISSKNIIALEIIMPTGGTSHKRGQPTKPLIPAGGKYTTNISAQSVGRTKDLVFVPNEMQPKGVINAVLFDDGTYEGNYVSAATMESTIRGRKIGSKRIVELLDKILRSQGSGSVTSESVEEEIYSLDISLGPDSLSELLDRYPPLNDQWQNIVAMAKGAVEACKYDLVYSFKERDLRQYTDLMVWLKSIKAKYEILLSN